ncbi:MAG: chorismate mutase [Anaerolineae bacterium]|jgi:chorismate mutase
MTTCRGIRGATTVEVNEAEAILNATAELLEQIVAANDVCEEDVVSVIFTMTPDLDAVYPAVAARQLGWTHTALICTQEMAIAGSLPRCIRVLVHWNTDRPIDRVRHVYLREARTLRPDLVTRELEGTRRNS